MYRSVIGAPRARFDLAAQTTAMHALACTECFAAGAEASCRGPEDALRMRVGRREAASAEGVAHGPKMHGQLLEPLRAPLGERSGRESGRRVVQGFAREPRGTSIDRGDVARGIGAEKVAAAGTDAVGERRQVSVRRATIALRGGVLGSLVPRSKLRGEIAR